MKKSTKVTAEKNATVYLLLNVHVNHICQVMSRFRVVQYSSTTNRNQLFILAMYHDIEFETRE